MVLVSRQWYMTSSNLVASSKHAFYVGTNSQIVLTKIHGTILSILQIILIINNRQARHFLVISVRSYRLHLSQITHQRYETSCILLRVNKLWKTTWNKYTKQLWYVRFVTEFLMLKYTNSITDNLFQVY